MRDGNDSVEVIRQEVTALWGGLPLGAAALAIISAFERSPETVSVTFTDLVRLAGVDLQDLIPAISALVSVSIVDIGYVLADGDAELPLDADMVADAVKNGEFSHPMTGQQVPNWKDAISPMVEPGERLRLAIATPTGATSIN